MKATKFTPVLITSFLSLFISLSSNATELVSIDPVDSVDFSNQIQIELALSIKSMQIITVSTKAVADTLLTAQTEQHTDNKNDIVTKTSLIAE